MTWSLRQINFKEKPKINGELQAKTKELCQQMQCVDISNKLKKKKNWEIKILARYLMTLRTSSKFCLDVIKVLRLYIFLKSRVTY